MGYDGTCDTCGFRTASMLPPPHSSQYYNGRFHPQQYTHSSTFTPVHQAVNRATGVQRAKKDGPPAPPAPSHLVVVVICTAEVQGAGQVERQLAVGLLGVLHGRRLARVPQPLVIRPPAGRGRQKQERVGGGSCGGEEAGASCPQLSGFPAHPSTPQEAPEVPLIPPIHPSRGAGPVAHSCPPPAPLTRAATSRVRPPAAGTCPPAHVTGQE